MQAAMQQTRATIQPLRSGSLLPPTPVRRSAAPQPMSTDKPRQFTIRGITADGREFRPSDWSERLAGAMSSFRPGSGTGGIGAYIGYSPYCVPLLQGGIRCVRVSEALKGIEPMAWDFVMNFARDNGLVVTEVEPRSTGSHPDS